MKKYALPYLIAFCALSVSASAAFYSVYGLSKLFAGASLQVIIMASSLEIAKLVSASLLYQYWETINKLLRTYLSIACVILMLITSMGIYGFLSGAYQETATKSEMLQKELMVVDMKRSRFNEQRDEIKAEKLLITETIKDLRKSLADPAKVQYIDKESGQLITTTSSSQRRALESQLSEAVSSRDALALHLEAVTDSISKLDLQILDRETSNDAERELGPLKYIASITGTPMDKVINWLLIMIVIVFDPLAVALVVAANFAFAQIFPKKAVEEKKPVENLESSEKNNIIKEETSKGQSKAANGKTKYWT